MKSCVVKYMPILQYIHILLSLVNWWDERIQISFLDRKKYLSDNPSGTPHFFAQVLNLSPCSSSLPMQYCSCACTQPSAEESFSSGKIVLIQPVSYSS